MIILTDALCSFGNCQFVILKLFVITNSADDSSVLIIMYKKKNAEIKQPQSYWKFVINNNLNIFLINFNKKHQKSLETEFIKN